MTRDGQTICLNMIVRNEAPVIRRCLDSVMPIIDSWVIVDTGSTDGTQTSSRASVHAACVLPSAQGRVRAKRRNRRSLGRARRLCLRDRRRAVAHARGFRDAPLRRRFQISTSLFGLPLSAQALLRDSFPGAESACCTNICREEARTEGFCPARHQAA